MPVFMCHLTRFMPASRFLSSVLSLIIWLITLPPFGVVSLSAYRHDVLFCGGNGFTLNSYCQLLHANLASTAFCTHAVQCSFCHVWQLWAFHLDRARYINQCDVSFNTFHASFTFLNACCRDSDLTSTSVSFVKNSSLWSIVIAYAHLLYCVPLWRNRSLVRSTDHCNIDNACSCVATIVDSRLFVGSFWLCQFQRNNELSDVWPNQNRGAPRRTAV